MIIIIPYILGQYKYLQNIIQFLKNYHIYVAHISPLDEIVLHDEENLVVDWSFQNDTCDKSM